MGRKNIYLTVMRNKQLHILIIDDNEDILFMMQAMLNHKGYKVTVKEDTRELDAAVKALSPDIIMMDMLLSGADGREICKKLKENVAFSGIPVIMLSAHPQAQTECIQAGANYFIEKPFEMAALMEIIAAAEVQGAR